MCFSMNTTAATSGLFKRLLCCLLALVALPLAAAATTAGRDESMIFGMLSATTQRCNPLQAVEREFMSLTALVYESLLTIGDDEQPKAGLAERWEASGSGESWTFTLREGVTFHDGTPLTAQDVVATIDEIKRLAADETTAYKGAYASVRYFVSSATATDARTVQIKTKRNNYSFPFAMTFPILPAAQVQAENPAGTGPYVISSFVPADYLQLTANPAWWNGTPALKEIMTIFHTGSRELINSYEYNRVDGVITRSLTAAQYRSGLNSQHLSYRTRQLETLQLNNRSYELADVEVRHAIRAAINIDSLANSTYMNMVLRTATPMVPGTWAYHEQPGILRYDPEGAKALLEAAGWVDSDDSGVRDKVIEGKKRELSLRFIVYEEQGNSVRIGAANQIASMLAGVGIECRIESLTFSQAAARLKAGNYDLAMAAFNMDVAPDPGFLLMKRNTGNYTGYASEQMDKLFETLRTTMDQEAYIQKLAEIQTLFLQDCPFICLYYRNGAVLTRRMFTNARSIREPEVLRGIEDGPGFE